MPSKVIRIRWRLAMGCAVLAIIALVVFLTGNDEVLVELTYRKP